MRGCFASFIEGIVIIALLVCAVIWMFETDFEIFDILLDIGLIALIVIAVLVAFVIVVYVIKELFG